MFVKFVKPTNKNIFVCDAVRLRLGSQELYINHVAHITLFKTAIRITLVDGTSARFAIYDNVTVHLYIYETQQMHVVSYIAYERVINEEWKYDKKLVVTPVG